VYYFDISSEFTGSRDVPVFHIVRDTSPDGSTVDIQTLTVKELVSNHAFDLVALGNGKFAAFFLPFRVSFSPNVTIVTIDANALSYSIQWNVSTGSPGTLFEGSFDTVVSHPLSNDKLYMKTYTKSTSSNITSQTISEFSRDSVGKFAPIATYSVKLDEVGHGFRRFAWLAPPQWEEGALAIWIGAAKIVGDQSWYIYTPETREVKAVFPMIASTDQTVLYDSRTRFLKQPPPNSFWIFVCRIEPVLTIRGYAYVTEINSMTNTAKMWYSLAAGPWQSFLLPNTSNAWGIQGVVYSNQ
jgi:hypothetical protein